MTLSKRFAACVSAPFLVFASVFVAALVFGPAPLGAQEPPTRGYVQHVSPHPLVVVELYTSQGCSSCPPADQLLADLNVRDDVLGLTFPITYWDDLGWPDTLASPKHTRRQMAYADRTNKGRVYTPQIIIDGVYHAVGSRRRDVIEKIAIRHQRKEPMVPIIVALKGADLTIEIDSGKQQPATIWLFPFSQVETVDIGGGENRGRSIRYTHVVGDVVRLGRWSGARTVLVHTLKGRNEHKYGYAVVLQAEAIGPILGAGWIASADSGDQQSAALPEPEPSTTPGSPLNVDWPR